MPAIPSFFNRLDFISILLPGYVLIIAYLIIFQPTFFFTEKELSFDIVSTVIFIVAGPAAGLTILQFHRSLNAIYSKIRNQETDEQFLKDYAAVCLKMTENEKSQLREVESYYDFSISTGLSLCLLSAYVFITFRFAMLAHLLVLLVGGLLLLVGGHLERTDSYSPMIKCLIEKYHKP